MAFHNVPLVNIPLGFYNIDSVDPSILGRDLERIRIINQNAYTEFKYVSRRPRVSTPKHTMHEAGIKLTVVKWSQIFDTVTSFAVGILKIFM